MDTEAQLLPTGKAAELCAVKPDTILKWIKKGQLKATRTAGGHYRIQRRDLEPLIPGAAGRPDPDPPTLSGYPHALRCWEYLSDPGVLRDECKRCVVYRVRAAWCFQVAGLGCEIGHAKQFCRNTCEDCAYYRRVSGLATNILVITQDEGLIERLIRDDNQRVVLRFARNSYEASAIISSFRPAFAVVDQAVSAKAETGLLDSLASDPRVPGLKIILGIRQGTGGRRREKPGKNIVGVLEKPFDRGRIAAVIDRFPVEPLAQNQGI